MDYIEKLDLQTEEIEEVETLEKHTIINNKPFTVDEYVGHDSDFLAIDGEYNDGFNQLNETKGLGINCPILKEVNDRIVSELNEIKSSLDNKANKEHTHEPQINCDTVDNLHFVCLTKSEYDALETKDSNTLYFIKKEVE